MPPTYDRTNPHDSSELARLRMILYIDERKKILKDRRDAEDVSKKMFSTIWGQMSIESQAMCELHPDWTAMNMKVVQSALHLVRIIRITHLNITSDVASMDMDELHKEFFDLKQYISESLYAYRIRLEEQLARIAAVNQSMVPTQDQCVTHFVTSLNFKHAKYKKAYINGSLEGQPVPTSLAAAEDMANKYALSNRSTIDQTQDRGTVMPVAGKVSRWR
jgi:hypothetical protein